MRERDEEPDYRKRANLRSPRMSPRSGQLHPEPRLPFSLETQQFSPSVPPVDLQPLDPDKVADPLVRQALLSGISFYPEPDPIYIHPEVLPPERKSLKDLTREDFRKNK